MKRYIGKLAFLTDSANNQLYLYLQSMPEGESIVYQINSQELQTIFSEELLEFAQKEGVLLDFYADINDKGELYNIKELTVYSKYFPS